jgi:hypothetical protein
MAAVPLGPIQGRRNDWIFVVQLSLSVRQAEQSPTTAARPSSRLLQPRSEEARGTSDDSVAQGEDVTVALVALC